MGELMMVGSGRRRGRTTRGRLTVTRRLRLFGVLIALAGASTSAPVLAAQASPPDFTPGPGTYGADTTALTLTGPGTNITGVVKHGVAVFSFNNVDISSSVTIDVGGDRPFELEAKGKFVLAGVINGSGDNATEGFAGPEVGGPGGGAGGAEFPDAGSGRGGGGAPTNEDQGGGGGGFGGVGAPGGHNPGDPGKAGKGGKTYGNLNVALRGGSGGGGSSDVGGGGGGGAIELSASTLRIAATGKVFVFGGNGSGGADGASGGGSGGAILLRAATIKVTGMLEANGGEGGTGGCCGDGGGGGGGRIAYQYGKLVNAGTAHVKGGKSGASGTYGHKWKSPDPFGGRGVITKTHR